MNGIATVGYSHSTQKGTTFGGRVNYTGRDASSEDGEVVLGSRALQFQAFTSIPMTSELEFSADAAVGYRYFPKMSVNAALKHTSPSDFEFAFGASYRLMPDDSYMIGVSIAPAITLGQFYIGGKFMPGIFQERMFVLGQTRLRFYPYDGGRTYLEAQAGVGTAPELDFSNIYYNAVSYNHLNSFVALGANWLLADNLSLNLSGSWHTLYGNKNDAVSYQNMLVGNVQFVIYF